MLLWYKKIVEAMWEIAESDPSVPRIWLTRIDDKRDRPGVAHPP
jgi:hypothetical protein